MSFKSLLYPSLLSCAILSSSCKEQPKSHDLTPPDKSKETNSESEIQAAPQTKAQTLSEADHESINQFRDELSKSVANGDPNFIIKNLNYLKLGQIATEGIEVKGNERRDFLLGFMKNSERVKQDTAESISQSQLTFIKFINETRPALLYRMILDDGSFAYVEFLLDRKSTDQWEIVDLYFHSNGRPNSSMIRETFTLIIGKTAQNDLHYKAFQQANKVQISIQNEEYNKAWELWKQIDPKMFSSRIITSLGYNIAYQNYNIAERGSPEGIKAQSQLIEVYQIMQDNFPKDPGFAILELAIHDINKDYPKYREAINTLKNKVGDDDIFLDSQDAIADIGEKKYDIAIAKIEKQLEAEPNISSPYLSLWTAYLKTKNYEAMGESLNEANILLDLDFTLMQQKEEYIPFFTSEVGKNWLKSKGL